jgi:hypothetical protein
MVEASRLGFERLVTGPSRGAARDERGTTGIVVARTIREALGAVLES